MKLIFITLLLFSVTAKAQDYKLNNVPLSNLYEGPIELKSTINVNLEPSSDTLTETLNQKVSKQHTIHAPKKALTLDEFQKLLLTKESTLNTEKKDASKSPFINKTRQ